MAAAMISLTEFFEGAAGSLVWLLCAFAAFWLMFYAPLGRRVFRRSVSIAATPEAVWSAMLLEPSPPNGWAGVLQIETQRFVEGPPLRHVAVVRFSARPGVTRTLVSRVLHLEPVKRLETEIESLDGVAWKASDAARTVSTLTEENGVTRLEQRFDVRPKGIFGHLWAPRFYDRYNDHLRAYCEGSAAPPARSAVSRSAAIGLGVAAVAASALMLGVGASEHSVWFYVLTAVCLEAAVLLHELGHYLVMRAFGHSDAAIMLIPFFGGATLGMRPMSSRYERTMIALGGPAFSALLVAALAPAAYWSIEAGAPDLDRLVSLLDGADARAAAAFVLIPLLSTMILLNIVNLAPLGMLDGGRAVDALASGRISRAVSITAVFAALGYATTPWVTANYLGSVAALLVAVWTYRLLSPHALDAESAPMSRRQSAAALATLAVTLAILVEASRTLLPDIAAAMQSGSERPEDMRPASAAREAYGDHTATP
jgi:Zn-dependent protease